MRNVVQLWKPILGSSFVFLVTGSLLLASAAFSLGVLLVTVPSLERAVSLVLRVVGSTVFVVGAALVVFATRVIAPARTNGEWQAAPARQTSQSSYALLPRAPGMRGALRSTSILLLALAALDVAGGSAIPLPPLIPSVERLEKAPSVKPGDIEYQVQRDGEHLYLTPTPGPRWHQTNLKSATTNWTAEDGRRTFHAPSKSLNITRVVVIGGSAAFGLGQSDDMTIASEMSKILNTRGQHVQIQNFGVPAYTTSQAVRDLDDRINNGLRVDTVVVYSGFNDVALGFFGRRVPQTLLDGATTTPSGPLAWWANHSAVARLFGHQPVRRKPLVWRVLNTNFDGSWELSTRTGADASRDALYNLEEGYRDLQALAKKHDVHVLFVYQPTWFESELAPIDKELVIMDDVGRELVGARWEAVRRAFVSRHTDVIDAMRFTDNVPCWLDYSHTRGVCSDSIVSQILKTPQWQETIAVGVK